MEVRLDADLDTSGFSPTETFVCLRIGDVQKQARLTPTRTFLFPESSWSNCAKVEIFQRIGVGAVRLDEAEAGAEFEVPCFIGEGDQEQEHTLSMQLFVQGATKDAAAEKKSRAKKRLDEAQQYLANHQVEDLLASAMKEMIHDKPEDPHVYLSKKMSKSASESKLKSRRKDESTIPFPEKPKLAPIDEDTLSVQAQKAVIPQAESPPMKPPPSDAKRAPLESVEMQVAQKAAPSPAEPVQAVKEDESDVLRKRVRHDMLQALRGGTLESHFAHQCEGATSSSNRQTQEEEAPASAEPVGEESLIEPASELDDVAPPPPPRASPPLPPSEPPRDEFGAFYSEELEAQAKGAIAEQANARQSVSAAALLLPTSERSQVSVRVLPSVSTWYTGSPVLPACCRGLLPSPTTSAPAATLLLPASERAVEHLKQLPSVGTWCAASPLRKQEQSQPANEFEQIPYLLKPSVASWHRVLPIQHERPWFLAKPEEMEGDPTEYIMNLQTLLVQQDEELEQLRRRVSLSEG